MASTTAAANRLWIAGLALAIAGLVSPGSFAQDQQLCSRLEAQLNDHIADRPPTRHYQRYVTAVEHQLRLIDRTRRDLVRMGCSDGSVIDYDDAYSDCRRVAGDLRRMQAELLDLQRRRDTHAGQNGSTARQRVIAALQANGCIAPSSVRIRQNLGVSGFEGHHDFSDPTPRYRTLCVRTCDGYYFPVSYSVPSMAFDGDAAECSAMCPGTEARLYVHRVPDEDSPDMVSAADQTPYALLPNAFAYRDRAVGQAPLCSCEISTPAQSALRTATESSIITFPADNDAASIEHVIEPPGSAPLRGHANDVQTQPLRDMDPNRRVRVIGPTFLPDRSDAMDLRAPIPSGNP